MLSAGFDCLLWGCTNSYKSMSCGCFVLCDFVDSLVVDVFYCLLVAVCTVCVWCDWCLQWFRGYVFGLFLCLFLFLGFAGLFGVLV